MSTQTRLFDSAATGKGRTAKPIRVTAAAPRGAPRAAYLPLVQKLAEMRRTQGTGVIAAFSALSSGDGVSFVVESLAWELAKQTGEHILVTTPGDLATAAAIRADESESGPVRRFGSGLDGGPHLLRNLEWADLQGLRQRFGFVLLDSPAITDSPLILAASRLCDGVVLVVAAGETRRREIGYAQSVLAAASAKLIGLVLNKQVDPIPGFISRFL